MAHRLWAAATAFILLASASLAQDSTTTVVTTRADSGVLNGPTKSASTTASNTGAPASTSVTSIDLSETHVPYLLQGPAASHVSHKTKPRVQTQFHGCSDPGLSLAAQANRINVSSVYVQYDPNPLSSVWGGAPHEAVLRIVGTGAVANESLGAADGYFSAIQATTRFLTFETLTNLTYLCDNIYPTAPDPNTTFSNHATCTYGPGTVAFGVDVPLNSSYRMGTLWTRVLLIDYSQPALALACIDIPVTSYDPSEWYWSLMFWLPAALFVAYFVLVSLGRAITAAATRARAFRNRAREGSSPSFLRDHLNPVIISALSGQGMILSPALLRFSSPGCWEILFQLQFVALLGMLAVAWPDFSYPFFQQAAWSTLVGNVTLIQSSSQAQFLVDPMQTNATLPAGDLGAQFSNVSSPLFMNSSAPQQLLNLNSSYTGLPAFAAMVGLHSEDMFGTCMAVWLLIVAVFVTVAIIGWFIDTIALAATKIKNSREAGPDYQLTGGSGANGGYDVKGQPPSEVYIDSDGNLKDVRSSTYGLLGSWPRGFRPSPHLHWAALHGNMVRAVAMFHLPITIYSVYQFANSDVFSKKSVILACIAFAIVSVMFPVYLIWRIASTRQARKLYDDGETLLALGPVYNTYSPGSQLFYVVTFAHSLIVGIVVGAAQRSGSAQAIIVLVMEILLGLATILWLPWGEGAMMGPISFMTSALRVSSAVLVVLLTPVVDLSTQAAGWITYVILLLQGIFFAGATVVLAVKLIESLIRLLWRVPYDERVNARSGGIGGAIRQIRRRKDKILQLNKPGRNGRHSRAESIGLADTSWQSGTGAISSGRPIPMTRSRQASFASYLDYFNAGHGQPLDSSGKSPMHSQRPSMSPADILMSGGPGAYNAYIQQDADDEDSHIMASMPPLSPGNYGGRVVMPSAVSPGSMTKPGMSRQVSGEGVPTIGFQRIGGGRATGMDPYAALAAGRAGGGPQRDNRDRWSTTEPYSSTSAAAQFARVQSQRQAASGAPRYPRGKGLSGLSLFSKSGHGHTTQADKDAAAFTAEEEEDVWNGTWGTSTLSTQHGPWNGLVKMQAALSGLKDKLAGRKGDDNNLDEGDEDEAAAASGSGGFQVLRDKRPQQSRRQREEEAEDVQQDPDDSTEQNMDSTAIAAAAARAASMHRPSTSSAQGQMSRPAPDRRQSQLAYLQSSPGHGSAGEQQQQRQQPPQRLHATNDGPPLLELRHLSNSPTIPTNREPANSRGNSRPTSTFSYSSASALGILGADLQRALTQSTIRDEPRSEDRFWLPPGAAAKRNSGVGSLGRGVFNEEEEEEGEAEGSGRAK